MDPPVDELLAEVELLDELDSVEDEVEDEEPSEPPEVSLLRADEPLDDEA